MRKLYTGCQLDLHMATKHTSTVALCHEAHHAAQQFSSRAICNNSWRARSINAKRTK